DQRVVTGIAPAGAVIAVAADHGRQERVGVEIVADPRAARDIVLEAARGLQIRAPFLVRELDLDPQLALPHRLDRFGDAPVVLAGVEQDRDPGESPAPRIAGPGE